MPGRLEVRCRVPAGPGVCVCVGVGVGADAGVGAGAAPAAGHRWGLESAAPLFAGREYMETSCLLVQLRTDQKNKSILVLRSSWMSPLNFQLSTGLLQIFPFRKCIL